MAKQLRLVLLADAGHVNTQRWCEGLSKAGADIIVVSFNGGSETLHSVRPPIPQLPGKLHYLAAMPYVRSVLNRVRPDVVAGYYVTGYGTLAALTGFHPLIQVTAGSDVLLAPQNPLMNRVVRNNFKRADLITAWAPHVAQAIRNLGGVEDQILVLPRGIPFVDFANLRCGEPEASDPLRIITTRALKADYNFDLLLQSVRLLSDEGIALSVTFAGDGPYAKNLEALSRELGLSKQVRFLGFVSNEELPAELAKHNVYVSLVSSDGVSASLLEAMAVGLLPIVPNHSANRSWIESGHNGVLLDQLTPAEIAKVIIGSFPNLGLRKRAWSDNTQLVREKADLYRNSELFVERFCELAKQHKSHRFAA